MQYCVPKSGKPAPSAVKLRLANREILKMRRIFSLVVTTGLLCCPITTTAQSSTNSCDLNGDGTVNVVDVQLAVNMALGRMTCTSFVNGPDVCNVLVVQRVINAALSGTCVVSPHSVSVSWTASTSLNVIGYNVYRGITSGGPYTKLNSSPVTTLNYTDATVVSGETYYYVTTAVDGSGNEGAYSTQLQAVVPSP
jgi:hypothetical protein